MIKKFFILPLAFLLALCTLTINISAEPDEERIFVKPGEVLYLTGDGTLDTSVSDYNSGVAKAEQVSLTGGDQIVHLGKNKSFDNGIDTLSSNLYTFEHDEGNNYKIYHENGSEKIYLKSGDQSIDIFHSSSESIMRVDAVDMDETDGVDMYFGFAQKGGTRRLFFEYQISKSPLCFNKWYQQTPTKDDVSLLFRIYKQEISEGGAISYTRVDSLDNITEGKYIIAARTNQSDTDHTLYVLRPTTEYGSYKQIAKWVVGETETTRTEVKVTVTSSNDGGYSCFKIGSKEYRISKAIVPEASNVTSDVRIANGGAHNNEVISKLTISKGDTFKVTTAEGHTALYWMSANDDIASVDQDGVITANSIVRDKGFGKTYIGYMDASEHKFHCIEVVVIETAYSANTTQTDMYMEIAEDSNVKVGYSFVLDAMKKNQPSYDNVGWDKIGGQIIKTAQDKEVFCIDTENSEEYAIVFFVKTSEDREFVNGDILNIIHPSDEDITFNETGKDNIDKYGTLTNVFKQSFIEELLDIAKNNGYVASVVLNKPEDNNPLKNHLKLGSSYVIDLKEPHTNQDGVTYSLKKDPITEDLETYKELFSLTDTQLTNSKFFDIYIKEGDNKLDNVVLNKKLSVAINVSDMLDYDTTKYSERVFTVYSKHGVEIINWGEYKADEEGKIKVNVDKFSIFAVVAKDKPKASPTPTPSNDEPETSKPIYKAPNTSAR